MGRHRRHFPPIRHGTGVLVPQAAERGTERLHRHTDHRGGHDVSGLYRRKRHGIHPHHESLPGRDALHVVDGHRVQGLQRHEPHAAEIHRHRARHPGGGGLGGSGHAGGAFHSGGQPAFRRLRPAGQPVQAGGIPHLLVGSGHLPPAHLHEEDTPLHQQRDPAHRLARPLPADGENCGGSRILVRVGSLRHGKA